MILKPIFAIFIVSYWTYTGWILLDLRAMKTQMPQLAQLQKENNIQKRQLLDLVGRIEAMKEKIVTLEKSDGKMMNMVTCLTVEDQIHSMGGGSSDLGIISSEYSDADNSLESVPLIPHSMDRIDHKINPKDSEGPDEAPSFGNQEYRDKEEKIYAEDNANNVDKKNIRRHLKEIALELGIDPRLALSMAKVESDYNPSLVSPKGAVGVLQVMPQFVSPDYGITEEMLFDPHINIRVGLSRMKSLLNRFGYDLDLSLAAYNAGASRVVKAGYRIPPIKETEAYVRKVKEIMENEV